MSTGFSPKGKLVCLCLGSLKRLWNEIRAVPVRSLKRIHDPNVFVFVPLPSIKGLNITLFAGVLVFVYDAGNNFVIDNAINILRITSKEGVSEISDRAYMFVLHLSP